MEDIFMELIKAGIDYSFAVIFKLSKKNRKMFLNVKCIFI